MLKKPTYEELKQKVTALEEGAPRESEEKYRAVLDTNPDPMVVYDMEGKVIYFNPAFTNLFGWSLEECMGKKMDDFFPYENRLETKMMIDRVRAGERFSWIETLHFTKDERKIPVGIRGLFYRNHEGNITVRVINLQDLSDQNKLELPLQQAHKMEIVGTLAGGIAHEFNNALTSIIGNIQLLEMDFPDNRTIKNYTSAMMSGSRRMADLTGKLLAYARGGKYQTKFISLKNFVKDNLPMVKSKVDPSIRIETELSNETFIIKVDPTQMQMVLSAVVINASEALEGEGRIRIIASNEKIDELFAKNHPGLKPGHYACLTVEDDGKGMEKKIVSKIFDPFFTTKFIGRGLGMAAVYGIIKNHNGYITVDSEPDKGTRIRIHLPAIENNELSVVSSRVQRIR